MYVLFIRHIEAVCKEVVGVVKADQAVERELVRENEWPRWGWKEPQTCIRQQ